MNDVLHVLVLAVLVGGALALVYFILRGELEELFYLRHHRKAKKRDRARRLANAAWLRAWRPDVGARVFYGPLPYLGEAFPGDLWPPKYDKTYRLIARDIKGDLWEGLNHDGWIRSSR